MARVSVTEAVEDGQARYHVRFAIPDPELFAHVKASFRAQFPRHGQAVYNGAAKHWSVNITQRRRLDDWIGRTFLPSAVNEDCPL